MDHHLEPTEYHSTFGSHPAVLTIEPGDRVITSTADAAGVDRHGQRVGPPGNPLTGPIAVEGAARGDMLVVHLERIEPNRDHGFTRSSVAAHVVEPDYIGELPEREMVHWQVDLDARSATLTDEQAIPAEVTLPFAPMLGCIGVAPPRGQAISTATSGPYGGNMDYRDVAPGATVMFPVFTDGALLFVGDGHARQGEGEIVGTGIEISMDVAFTVDLVKDHPTHTPRMETATHLIALGNARPLEEALQRATTELMRWLRAEHGYDGRGASHLLGQAIEYDIGNVFDPAYTVAAKIARRHLED
jgi:acetamidase/formamidase